MKIQIQAAISAASFLAALAGAQAQVVQPTLVGTNYLAIVGDNSQGGNCTTASGPCVSPGRGIPLSYYTTSSDFNAAMTSLNASIASINASIASINASIASLNNRLGAGLNHAFDGAAAGIAMRDAVPNSGDQFAVRFNMGTLNSHVAGSVGFAANVTDDVRLLVNYGQSRTQSAFSAGLNFSFN